MSSRSGNFTASFRFPEPKVAFACLCSSYRFVSLLICFFGLNVLFLSWLMGENAAKLKRQQKSRNKQRETEKKKTAVLLNQLRAVKTGT
jgi:hypothetical protein